MKKGALLLALMLIIYFTNTDSSFGHKPIQSNGLNINFEDAILIPDHKISWVIYEELEPFQTKFYKFDAKKDDSFYASIVIPKMERFESFKPSLALIGEEIKINSIHKMDSTVPPGGIVVYNYDGEIPSDEFYEPFGQTTYWERQETRIVIPADGIYYIAVFDSQGVLGKYSLSVGVIEDFSITDFFTVLPFAWFQTKLFFEDYFSIAIVFLIVFGIPITAILLLRNKKIKKEIKIKK